MASPRIRRGRRPLPAGLRRAHGTRVNFNRSDWDDLGRIAEAWRVPRGVVIWAFVRSELARARRQRRPDLGQYGLEIAAGLQVLRLKWPEERSEGKVGSSDGSK